MDSARTVEGTLISVSGMAFKVTTGSGHTLTLDSSVEHGGSSLGPTPMDMLLVGLAGCTGMDVISLLRKMRQDVTAYAVNVSGIQENEHPRVFREVVVEHVVTGRNLDHGRVEHAVELSATKYCPVSATLAGVGSVRHTTTVLEKDA